MSFDLLPAVLWKSALPLIVIAYFLKRSATSQKVRLPKPPGPRRWPLIGSLLQMPSPTGKLAPWRVYDQWRKQYGNLVYLEAFGEKILILNSLEAVDALLNKRSTNYSDRAQSPLLFLSRHNWSFGFLNYGAHWRDQRREFHQFFNQTHVRQPEIRQVIDQEVPKLLRSLIDQPSDYTESLKLFYGIIIMRLSYGLSVHNEEKTKAFINIVAKLATEQALAFQPGRYLVGFIPWLKYVPEWFPGAGWKKRLEELGCLNDRVLKEPFEELQERLSNGLRSEDAELTPNVATQLIKKLPEETSDDFIYRSSIAQGVAAASYIAGVDTTLTSTLALLLALAMYPEVQCKAQSQVDTLLRGQGSRLPSWDDLEQVPYIRAILEEVKRWHTVLPLSLPHVSREDDIYEGYLIPAKTTILPNTWAIMHDAENFEDPFEFKPERYLTREGKINPKVLNSENGSFGYGRRICPGRHLSNETLSIVAIHILAGFDVLPAVDESGNPKVLSLEVTSSILSVPLPFDIDIKPRSSKYVDLIRDLE